VYDLWRHRLETEEIDKGKLVNVQRALDAKKTAKGTEFIDAVTVLNGLLTTLEKPTVSPVQLDNATEKRLGAFAQLARDISRIEIPDTQAQVDALAGDMDRLISSIGRMTDALTSIKIEVPQPKPQDYVFDIERNRGGYLKRVVAKPQ